MYKMLKFTFHFHFLCIFRAGIFKEAMGAIGTEEKEDYCTGPPGNIGLRNSLLGIDYGAP
jgi:hypothetical protein